MAGAACVEIFFMLCIFRHIRTANPETLDAFPSRPVFPLARPFSTSQLSQSPGSKYKPSKIKFMYQFEKVVIEYCVTGDFTKIFNMLKTTIQGNDGHGGKARAWANKWRNKRLYEDDFASVFWEEAEKVCYGPKNFDYLTYETIMVAMDRRAIDLTRKATLTKQGEFECSVARFNREEAFKDQAVSIEDEVLNKLVVQQILNDPALTMEERHLLAVIYETPNLSFQELACLSGLKHHEQVRRILTRIKNKLSDYKE